MMPPNGLYLACKKPSPNEKLFSEVLGRLEFAANRFALRCSMFSTFPTAGELERTLARRGDKLSQKYESEKSLRKASECFLQAAALCEVKGIADDYRKSAAVLTDMAGRLQEASKRKKP